MTRPVEGDRIRPVEALLALAAAMRDKDDTTAIFRVIDAVAGDTRNWAYRRACASDAGLDMMADRPSLSAALGDRAALGRLPQGSLGRAYLAFVQGEKLTPDGLISASRAGRTSNDGAAAENWFRARTRDQHDLWHVLTGYGREAFGETCLLAFTHEQLRNRGFDVLTHAAVARSLAVSPATPILSAVAEARRRARACAWLPDQPWESLLAEPLAALRDSLGVPPAPVYAKASADRARMTQRRLAAQAA